MFQPLIRVAGLKRPPQYVKVRCPLANLAKIIPFDVKESAPRTIADVTTINPLRIVWRHQNKDSFILVDLRHLSNDDQAAIQALSKIHPVYCSTYSMFHGFRSGYILPFRLRKPSKITPMNFEERKIWQRSCDGQESTSCSRPL